MGGARVTALARPRSTSCWNSASKTVGWGAGGKEKAVTVSSSRTAPAGPLFFQFSPTPDSRRVSWGRAAGSSSSPYRASW